MALNPLFPDEEPRALSVGKPNIPDFIPEAETKASRYSFRSTGENC